MDGRIINLGDKRGVTRPHGDQHEATMRDDDLVRRRWRATTRRPGARCSVDEWSTSDFNSQKMKIWLTNCTCDWPPHKPNPVFGTLSSEPGVQTLPPKAYVVNGDCATTLRKNLAYMPRTKNCIILPVRRKPPFVDEVHACAFCSSTNSFGKKVCRRGVSRGCLKLHWKEVARASGAEKNARGNALAAPCRAPSLQRKPTVLKELFTTTLPKLAKNPIYFLGWSNLAASRSGFQPTLEHAFSGKILGRFFASHTTLIAQAAECWSCTWTRTACQNTNRSSTGWVCSPLQALCLWRQNSTCLQTTQVWFLELTLCNSSKDFLCLWAVERHFGHGADIELEAGATMPCKFSCLTVVAIDGPIMGLTYSTLISSLGLLPLLSSLLHRRGGFAKRLKTKIFGYWHAGQLTS